MEQIDDVMITYDLAISLFFYVKIGLKLPNSFSNVLVDDLIPRGLIRKHLLCFNFTNLALLNRLLFHILQNVCIPFNIVKQS